MALTAFAVMSEGRGSNASQDRGRFRTSNVTTAEESLQRATTRRAPRSAKLVAGVGPGAEAGPSTLAGRKPRQQVPTGSGMAPAHAAERVIRVQNRGHHHARSACLDP